MSAENKMKRVRAPNWETVEKKLLKEVLSEYINIIENKRTDTNSNARKLKAWQKVFQRFSEHNIRPRTLMELRQQWRICKAKKKVSANRMRSNRTSGDGRPSGSDEDQVSPLGYEMDQNKEDDAPQEVKVEIKSPNRQSPYLEKTSSQEVHGYMLGNASQIVQNTMLINQAVAQNMHEEHETKMKQMTEMHEINLQHLIEAHEWGRQEHLLKLKLLEQQLLSLNNNN